MAIAIDGIDAKKENFVWYGLIDKARLFMTGRGNCQPCVVQMTQW